MTYPLAHRIDMRHKYVPSDETDIRKTFERIRDAANKDKSILDADPVSAGSAAGAESGISTAECH